jgi:hypothetical protein
MKFFNPSLELVLTLFIVIWFGSILFFKGPSNNIPHDIYPECVNAYDC